LCRPSVHVRRSRCVGVGVGVGVAVGVWVWVWVEGGGVVALVNGVVSVDVMATLCENAS